MNDLSASLDGTSIPPLVALTPLSGLNFGSGAIQVGPLLMLLDLLGIALVYQLVRRNWTTPEDQPS